MRTLVNPPIEAGCARPPRFLLALGVLLVLFLAGPLPAATIPGTRIVIAPTLLSPDGGTLVTASFSGGTRFYTGATPPACRIRLTQGSDLLNLIEPESVSPTRLTFRFPRLKTGDYGFQVQVQNKLTGAWLVVHESSPRFFRVGTDISRSLVFAAVPEGNLALNPSSFVDTGRYTARGVISGQATLPVDVMASVVDLPWLKEFCWLPKPDWVEATTGVRPCSMDGIILKFDVGLRGTADFEYTIPFADNGAIPDGRQVAFLQQDGALKQVVKGLVAGATYRVEYWENGRQSWYQGGNNGAVLEVRMGTTVIVPAHPVPPRQAYLQQASQSVVATGPQMELAFVKTGPAGLDRTVLIDQVRVICCTMPTTSPRLSTVLGPGKLTMSWDPAMTGFTLETTQSLKPPVQWTPVPGVVGKQAVVTPVQGATRFYRLRK